jgi:hypothetical protein
VEESNKKRTEDSKICPYFHQLYALYKEKGKGDNSGGSGGSSQGVMRDNMTASLMVRPEQQWPPQQEEDRMNRTMERKKIIWMKMIRKEMTKTKKTWMKVVVVVTLR